jgi:3-oxoacyl-[acyl-carrier-protein] synthase II
MSDREVWVTGIGIACPLGIDLDTVAEAQRESRSGAVALTDVFEAPGLPVLAACVVPDWDLVSALGEHAAPLVGRDDRKTEFGLYAALQALRHSFGDLATARAAGEGRNFGVHLASGLVSASVGDTETGLLRRLTPEGEYDHALAARLMREPSPFRGRHFTDRTNHLLARRLGWTGPSIVNHAACAAGATAIGMGARWVRRGRCDVVLAGGFESMVHPFGLLSFQLLGALSERRDCAPWEVSRPFDRTRDGFVIGEGAAVLILEAAGHARKRGATCHGRILGLGTSMDSHRITAPPDDGRGAVVAMRAALAEAGLDASDIEYINAHGTGTPLNDSAETAAIHRVFGPRGEAPPVSSSKSALGHTVAAAGAVEAALVLLAMRDGILPPTLNLHEPDPECDLDCVPRVARAQPTSRVLSNSFGFGGVNASLVLGGA